MDKYEYCGNCHWWKAKSKKQPASFMPAAKRDGYCYALPPVINLAKLKEALDLSLEDDIKEEMKDAENWVRPVTMEDDYCEHYKDR